MRRTHLAILGFVLVAAGFLALAASGSGRADLTAAAGVLRDARPGWILLAAASCGCALLCSARAWAVGLRICGGEASYAQVAARYSVGSLVNSFAPAHLGAAARIALMSRTLPCSDRLWQAGGVGAAVGVARGLGLALLVVVAAALGRIPVWPAPVLAALTLAVFVVGSRAADRFPGRVGSVLCVFGRLRRRDAGGPRLVGWICCSVAARVGAAAAAAAALGVAQPLWVAVILLAAVSLAGMLPLTPGNFGVGAGAATLALHGFGVGLGESLALGVAFQAVETVAAITLGLFGAAVLAAPGTPVRRLAFAGSVAATVVVAGVLGFAAVDVV